MEKKVVIINCYNIGALGTNCYCVAGEDFAFVIDPAEAHGDLLAFANEHADKPYKYILLTHCHIDHIVGVEALRGIWNCPVVISENDAEALGNPELNLSRMIFGVNFEAKADVTVRDGDTLNLGSATIGVLATAGHTPGSVCYILGEYMFSGDTLFKGSIGRTDFPRSDTSEMLRSLKKLAALTTDYKVYSGHGEPTTLFYEKKFNPFMR